MQVFKAAYCKYLYTIVGGYQGGYLEGEFRVEFGRKWLHFQKGQGVPPA